MQERVVWSPSPMSSCRALRIRACSWSSKFDMPQNYEKGVCERFEFGGMEAGAVRQECRDCVIAAGNGSPAEIAYRLFVLRKALSDSRHYVSGALRRKIPIPRRCCLCV